MGKTKRTAAPARKDKVERKKRQVKATEPTRLPPVQDGDVKIEYHGITEVVRWPRNPKGHDDAGIDESFDEFGFVEPPAMDELTGRLVAGHGRIERLLALKRAGRPPPKRIRVRERDGEWLVPIVRGIAFDTEAKAQKYVMTSNRLVEKGGWIEDDLSAFLSELRAMNESMVGSGWSEQEVDDLIKASQQPDTITQATTGMTPQQWNETYQRGTIKQIVIYLEAAQYDETLPRMRILMEKLGLESHTDLFLRLLEHYEKTGPRPAAEAAE